jgi:hypothetical protein
VPRSAPAPVSVRRSAAAAASLQAAVPPTSQALPLVRERITFPSSPDSDDWDTPAFQRQQRQNV